MALPGNKWDWNRGRKWSDGFPSFRIIHIIEKACSSTGIISLSAASLFQRYLRGRKTNVSKPFNRKYHTKDGSSSFSFSFISLRMVASVTLMFLIPPSSA